MSFGAAQGSSQTMTRHAGTTLSPGGSTGSPWGGPPSMSRTTATGADLARSRITTAHAAFRAEPLKSGQQPRLGGLEFLIGQPTLAAQLGVLTGLRGRVPTGRAGTDGAVLRELIARRPSVWTTSGGWRWPALSTGRRVRR
jgi:hypothetical protein